MMTNITTEVTPATTVPITAPTSSRHDPLVQFRDVGKGDSGSPALDGITLDVRRGEFMTLLGPAGAGKTTLLTLLAGFALHDRGHITLDSRSVHRTPPERRDLGLVVTRDGLFAHKTVKQNVAFPLRLRGVGREECAERVARMLDLVHLVGVEHRRPAMLSLEERQRVALARALVFRPKLLLLDEPLKLLGGTAREAFARDLRRLHDRLGLTILYATREAAEALALSDRIAVLHQGRIRQIAAPSQLYAEPADAFVARIAGQNNLLPGVIENSDEDEAEVRLNAGPKVSARPVHTFQTGDPCVIAIRPERVALVRADAADMGDDALPARLEQVVFLGADLSLRLRVAWQRGQWAGMDARAAAEIIVRRPAGIGLAGLAPGDTAALAWRPTDALAFRPE